MERVRSELEKAKTDQITSTTPTEPLLPIQPNQVFHGTSLLLTLSSMHNYILRPKPIVHVA